MSSFADDTKVWRGVLNSTCERTLQNELDHIYTWAANNNMEFNTNKFQSVRFNEILNPENNNNYKGSDGKKITQVKTVKDLGLHIAEDLTFTYHIHKVIKKGKQMAGWILRTFKGRTLPVMKTLLKQLVVPCVEYCSILWDPQNQALINRLESVQKNFTSRIAYRNGTEHLNYWQRLKELKIYSLQRRRERYAILYTWKVLHGIYPNPGIKLNEAFPNIHEAHPNQGIDITSYNERSSVIAAGHQTDESHPRLENLSILKRCCELYNATPPSMRHLMEPNDTPSYTKFKTSLDAWLQEIPDQPTIPGNHRIATTNSIISQSQIITRN